MAYCTLLTHCEIGHLIAYLGVGLSQLANSWLTVTRHMTDGEPFQLTNSQQTVPRHMADCTM